MTTFKLVFLTIFVHHILAQYASLSEWCENQGLVKNTFFWNGEQCLPCNSGCTCKSWNTCDTCLETNHKKDTPETTLNASRLDFTYSQPRKNTEMCTNWPQIFRTIAVEDCSEVCTDFARSSLGCTNCRENYFLNNTVCSPCPNNCTSCKLASDDDINTLQCTACESGHILNDEGFCVESNCFDNCETCVQRTNSNRYDCTKCLQGYGLINNKCLACNVRGCAVCHDSQINNCSVCLGQWSPNPNVAGTCILCQRNCLKCTNNATCSLCNNGYYVSQTSETTQACVKCADSRAVQCNATHVQACRVGYVPANNTCKQAAEFCKKHDGINGTCLECYEGYFLSRGRCLSETQLKAQVPNCLNYTQGSASVAITCEVCPLGFNLTSRGTCQSCRQNCETCSENFTCTKCRSGYGVNPGNRCSQCSSTSCTSCLFLQGTQKCTACVEGYYLLDGACLQCPAGCRNCSIPNVCNKCYGGTRNNSYILNGNGVCEQAATSCALSDGTGCVFCVSGYKLNDEGQCVDCLQDNSCQVTCSAYNLKYSDGFKSGYYGEPPITVSGSFLSINIFLLIIAYFAFVL